MSNRWKGGPKSELSWGLSETELQLSGKLTLRHLEPVLEDVQSALKKYPHDTLDINLGQVTHIDSSGVAFLNMIRKDGVKENLTVTLREVPQHIQSAIETFSLKGEIGPEKRHPVSFIQTVGDKTYQFLHDDLPQFLYLLADSMYFSVTDIFNHRHRRKGDFVRQMVRIGSDAVPIIALISLLIGLVLALQSAAQLRQFGVNIFVADLIVISMAREMGPLLTAIMLAGRSGSSIASEIGTMVITEEVDALRTMAVNPVRYIVVPKMQAMIVSLPLLAIISIILGVLGGMIIGYFYLDITPVIFYHRIQDALIFWDIFTGFVKSLIFAGLIVITASFYGFSVKGGAEGVGKITTASVVTSIFLVILADSAMGLLFYFE